MQLMIMKQTYYDDLDSFYTSYLEFDVNSYLKVGIIFPFRASFHTRTSNGRNIAIYVKTTLTWTKFQDNMKQMLTFDLSSIVIQFEKRKRSFQELKYILISWKLIN